MDRKILRKMFHDVAAFIVLGALEVSIKTCQGQKAEPALVQRLKILGTTLPLHLWSLRTTFRTLLPWKHKLDHTLLEMSLTKYLLKFMQHVGLPGCHRNPKGVFFFTLVPNRRFLLSFGAGHNVAIYGLIPTIHHHQKMSKNMAICRPEIDGWKKCWKITKY